MRPLWLIGLVGCGPALPIEHLDQGAWSALPPEHPLAGEDCSELAFSLEGGAIEIETEGCAPVAIGQTLAEPIERGSELEIVWWHDWLASLEPATGSFALYVDGAELYRRERDIPGPPDATTESFVAPVGGAELVLRIDNHGANTWDLLRLTRVK